MLGILVGQRVSGGCEHCNAYQMVETNFDGHEGIHLIRVYHDDDCPELARMDKRGWTDRG